jgi:hypothetical protein
MGELLDLPVLGSPPNSARRSSSAGRRRLHRSLENFDENNTLQPLLNSPRSLEACRRQGLEPHEFVYRHPESFEEQGVSGEIVQLRWRHYEKKRREKLHWALEERQQLVISGWQQPKTRPSSTPRGGSKKASLSSFDVGDSAAALKEQRALEAIKAKRQQEMEQLVAQEMKMAQMQADNAEKLEKESRKKLEAERQKLERQKEWDEAQRQKDLERAAADAEQQRHMKQMAVLEYKKEQERKEKTEFEEKMRMEEMRAREITAKISRQQAKAQLLSILEQQEAVLAAKKKEMEEKDLRHKAEMEAKRVEALFRSEEQRQRAKARLLASAERGKTLVLKQKEEYTE